MKKRFMLLALVAMLIMAFAVPACAYTNYYTTPYYTGYGYYVGNNYYTNWSNGLWSNSYNVGNYNYTNWNTGLSSTGYSVGNTYYTNYNNGLSYTKRTIGNYDYYTIGGRTYIGYWIGKIYYIK
jgi:hypothetical protein